MQIVYLLIVLFVSENVIYSDCVLCRRSRYVQNNKLIVLIMYYSVLLVINNY